jgi:hypothetical protein
VTTTRVTQTLPSTPKRLALTGFRKYRRFPTSERGCAASKKLAGLILSIGLTQIDSMRWRFLLPLT